MIKDHELLEKYNEIWEKLKNKLKKEFDSEPVYNKQYLNAKKNPIMKISTLISTTAKYKNAVMNIFAYK